MCRPTSRLTVVAAVIFDDGGRVLLARRPDGRHMAGLWEFPGGKVGANESPEDALGREIREELGAELEIVEPLTFAVHSEPGLEILLLFYRARIICGTPFGREGQAIRWVEASRLGEFPTPPADRSLVQLLATGFITR